MKRREPLALRATPGRAATWRSSPAARHCSTAASQPLREKMKKIAGSRPSSSSSRMSAVREGRWIVVPLWHPQFLQARYRIRALEEPLGLLGGVDHATLLVRRDAEERIGEAALDELSRLHLGNVRVSELDDRIAREDVA